MILILKKQNNISIIKKQGFKILSCKQWLQRLSVTQTPVKVGNTSEHLTKEI